MHKIFGVTFLLLFILGIQGTTLFGQSFEMMLPVDLPNTESLCAGELEKNKYFLVRSSENQNTTNGIVNLEVVVLDSCGVLESHVFPVESTFYIRYCERYFATENSLVLELVVNPYGLRGNHTEMGLMTISLDDWTATYKYLQGRNVLYNYGLEPEGEGYVAFGLVSYIDKAPMYYLNQVDDNLNVLKGVSFFSTYTGGGSMQKVNGGYICMTNETVHYFDNDLNVIWSKKLSSKSWVGHSILLEDGIVFVLREISDGKPSFMKMSFTGEIIWTSLHLSVIKSALGIHVMQDGDRLVCFSAFFDINTVSHYLIKRSFSLATGEIVESKRKRLNYGSFKLIDVSKTTHGYIVLGRDGDENSIIIHVDNGDESCTEEDDFDLDGEENYALLDYNLNGLIDETFYSGILDIKSKEIDRSATILCENIDPTFDLLPSDTIVCHGSTYFANISQNPYKVIWDDGDTSKQKSLTTGIHEYSYKICDETYDEVIDVHAEDCTCQVYIPSAFSPNEDGVNDYFSIYPNCKEFNLHGLKVFDRWGNLVFETENENQKWNGFFRGKKCSSENYTVQLIYSAFGEEGNVVKTTELKLMN